MSSKVKDRLSLRSVISSIQRVAVYETRTRTYIVGSTNDGRSCRILKIDRIHPPTSGLLIEEDEKEYQQSEIQETLIMLEGANRNSTTRYKSGLQQIASAFGIVGFIRFLEGYYIILITKRKPIATIGGNIIYRIEDTFMYYISAPSTKPGNPDESRYLKIFQNVDLSSNFYFSYSYDLTHSLQCQMRTHPGPSPPPCRKFIWNDHMLQQFEGYVHSRWILHITHGFISQINISVFGRPIFLTLIARRSREFAGTRFLKRGSNDEGHVANEVETEQIVHDASTSIHPNGRYTTFLQLRGSVPAFWSQDIASMRPKPQITIDRATPYATPAGHHFSSCLKRYGSPIICFDLVKLCEKRKHECLLSEELQSSITYLNQFLPPEHHIQYIHKDMARIHKRKKNDLIRILEGVAEENIQKTGIFHSGPELYCHQINPHPKYLLLGGYGYKEGYIGRDQTGLVRVNCVDCLDRTNTAQFIMGKCALGYQLYVLGILEDPHVPFECDTMRLLEEAYEDLGDSLAVQYGGSSLVHRIQTYRKVAPMKSHGRDIYHTTLRYARNAFTDTDKQMAINVFLGVFIPNEGEPNIWDLPTDYYLHHTNSRVPQPQKSSTSHRKWWTDRLIASLPLPQLEVKDDDEEEEEEEEERGEMDEVHLDRFDEVYRTYELTDFDRLLSRSIARTGDNMSFKDSAEASPLVIRDKQKKKPSSKHPGRITSGGIPRTKQEDDDSSSTSEDEEENLQSLPRQQDNHHSPQPVISSGYHSNTQGLPSSLEYYGFELKDPLDADKKIYDRYAAIYQLSCVPRDLNSEELTSAHVEMEKKIWKPLGNYGNDSIYSTSPPKVPEESIKIYDQCVLVAQQGAFKPSANDIQIYDQYTQEYPKGIP